MGTGRWNDDNRWEQGRSPRNRRPDDEWRSSRTSSRGGRDYDGGRGGGGGGGGGGGEWDRPQRSGSRYPRRDAEEDWGSGSYGGRGGRPGGSARGGAPDRSGGSMRGGRPPARDDWNDPRGGRGGQGYAGSSRRPPQGGGIWGDEAPGPRGRPGMGGIRDPRDPRDPRARLARRMEPEPEGMTFSKSLGIIFGTFLLGVAAAFVFFMVSRPTPQLDNVNPVPTNTTSPDVTPTTAPNVTPSPSGLLPSGPAFVFDVAGDAPTL